MCANRIYVQKGIYPLFASKLAERVGKFKVGHGFNPDTTHGPLINEKAIHKVQRHIDDAVSKGAEVLVGGKHLGGNFFEPSVVTGMTKEMLISSEETFGPIAALFEFSTEDEVIELANNTEFGLASYFYSRDIGRIWRVAEKLETGMVGANSPILSSCYTPFGGIKESGVGREGQLTCVNMCKQCDALIRLLTYMHRLEIWYRRLPQSQVYQHGRYLGYVSVYSYVNRTCFLPRHHLLDLEL